MSKRGGGGDSPPPSSLCVSWWSWGRRWASPTPPSHLSWWAWGQVRGWGWSSATVDEKAKKKKTWDRYQPREVKAIILHRKETERKGSRGSQGCRSGSKCHEKRKTKISDMDPDTFFSTWHSIWSCRSIHYRMQHGICEADLLLNIFELQNNVEYWLFPTECDALRTKQCPRHHGTLKLSGIQTA